MNLATHLLLDILDNHVDAVIAISNDSDLMLPLRSARREGASWHRQPE